MQLGYLQTINDAARTNILKVVARERDDAVPLDVRLAVTPSPEAIEDYLYFAREQAVRPTAARLAWDLRRLYPNQRGHDLLTLAAEVFEEVPLDYCEDSTPYIDQLLAGADRPQKLTDRFLVDAMDEAVAQGWQPPEPLKSKLAEMLAAASARESERREREEAQWQADMDADYAAWKASGEPDWYEEWKVKRAALVSTALPPGTPGPGGIPMLGAQTVIADLGRPIVDGFLANQAGRAAADGPRLPAVMAGHPLAEPLDRAISHIVATAEQSPANFRAAPVLETLAVLSLVHEDTHKAVVARLRSMGCALPEGKLATAVASFEARVNRELRSGAGYRTNAKGDPDPQNADNLSVFLSRIGVEARFNQFQQRVEVKPPNADWQPLTDAELNHLRSVASQDEHRFRPTKEFFRDMLGALARQNSYEPVRDYIDQAEANWDGQPRLAIWLSRACGTACDPYHQAVGKNVIGGLVRRARHAGCKHDQVMILMGPQGTGKSTLTRILALQDQWHTDSLAFDGSPQNLVPQMFGKTVIELAELAGLARREIESTKRFLSAHSDHLALKYETLATEHPRRCIFIGTTNDDAPLMDTTGNRRFLPVRVESQIDLAWLRENIEHLVGEAAALESAGETFGIPREVWDAAATMQEAARAELPMEVLLQAWLGNAPTDSFITSQDLLHALTSAKQSTTGKGLAPHMKRLGFRRFQSRAPMLGKVRGWIKSAGDNVATCVRLMPVVSVSGAVEMRVRPLTIPQ